MKVKSQLINTVLVFVINYLVTTCIVLYVYTVLLYILFCMQLLYLYYYLINVIRNIHNLCEYMYEFPDF